MLPWFLRDPARLNAERLAIADLERDSSWLVGHDWVLCGGLCIDFVVRAHDVDYELRLEYPPLFPDAPIVVHPRNADVRWSTHQYGDRNGPLCLEWGPDNWHPDVSARQLIESAHRLLDIENPLGVSEPRAALPAPSRHALVHGQEVRGALVRWLSSPAFADFLLSESAYASGSFKFSLRGLGETWVLLVHEALSSQGEPWCDQQIPRTIVGARPSDWSNGVWVKTQLPGELVERASTHADLQALLTGSSVSTLLDAGNEFVSATFAAVAVVDASGGAHLFLLISEGTAIRCSAVKQVTDEHNVRAPDQMQLASRRIGLVGLGSAGSKIATSLVRMGVLSFYLVDYDVLLPENLQRHAATWQCVGRHKVDAAEALIGEISSTATVEVSRIHLTGQESNAVINGVLARLSECDLIVDATADSKVFNLTAAVAVRYLKPLVWMEVFGGGVGGLVARSRPEVDPTPQDMRQLYLQYCTENPAPESMRAAADYAPPAERGGVLGASDADVAIIAHHTARMIVDCFRAPATSHYPFSMYLVGLEKAWVFDAPFATQPISTSFLPVRTAENIEPEQAGSVELEFLQSLRVKDTA